MAAAKCVVRSAFSRSTCSRRSNYGNASFWATFQDQRERKVTIAGNGQRTVESTRIYREGDGPRSWSVRTHSVVSHGPDGYRQSRERTRGP